MANKEHLAILNQGVKEWNEWRNKNSTNGDLVGAVLVGATLVGANLQQADLRNADLRQTDLSKADLSKANLCGANFAGAKLRETKLSYANLESAYLNEVHLHGVNLNDANLVGTRLRDSNLSEADLVYAQFVGAQLESANFSNSKMGQTTLEQIDLSTVIGLETVRHIMPSKIHIDTLYLSAGKIPELFLRCAGVPNNLITFIKSLTTHPIEFYSCFISYSTKDQEFAERLYADLQSRNVRCWFAPHDLYSGRKLHEQIDEAIRLHEKLLLILSESSMASEWVKTEIAKARKREACEKKQMLFPVGLVPFEAIRDWECFDADAGKDSAREIREYFIPDFSEWKDHDKYMKAFDRLMRDLKTAASAK